MKIEIRNVANGVVLQIEPEQPGDEAQEIVYQAHDHAEVEAFAEFLRYLVDHYGPHTSRYSPKRIYVRVEPVDKFEPPVNKEIMRK